MMSVWVLIEHYPVGGEVVVFATWGAAREHVLNRIADGNDQWYDDQQWPQDYPDAIEALSAVQADIVVEQFLRFWDDELDLKQQPGDRRPGVMADESDR